MNSYPLSWTTSLNGKHRLLPIHPEFFPLYQIWTPLNMVLKLFCNGIVERKALFFIIFRLQFLCITQLCCRKTIIPSMTWQLRRGCQWKVLSSTCQQSDTRPGVSSPTCLFTTATTISSLIASFSLLSVPSSNLCTNSGVLASSTFLAFWLVRPILC